MRNYIFFAIIVFSFYHISAQESDETVDTSSVEKVEEFISFTYTILPSEMTNSFFNVSHDTVTFRLVYVDVQCNDYNYQFKRDGKSLIVRRVTDDLDGCDEEGEGIYAFEGTLTDVPKGKSLFELESVYSGKKNTLFREVLVVK